MIDVITGNLELWTTAQKHKKAVGRGKAKKEEGYGIKKLRELILELAVRGKLVPQDADDEPASILLEKIAEEKQRLLEGGVIKKQKALPNITDDEKLFDLPNGWEWGRLGDISNYGISDKAQPDEIELDVWVLELEDVEKVTSRLIKRVRYSDRSFKSAKNRFTKNDVIYGKLRPYLDKVIVADEDGVCTTEMIPVRAYLSVIPQYLRLVMKSPYFILYANNSTHGMNLPRMGTEKARLALIPVIPEKEQHRIVAKVDELMALCDQLEQQQGDQIATHQTLVETLLNGLILRQAQDERGYSNQPERDYSVRPELVEGYASTSSAQTGFEPVWSIIAQHFDTLFTTEHSIDQLKQTILQLAVMGKLVPQNPKDEPASVLLEKIAQEKTKLIEEGKIKKQKALPEIGEDEKPFELPDGWEWSRLPEIGELARGKSKHRPRNAPLLYDGGTIPLVQTGDVARADPLVLTYANKYNQVGLEQSRLWSTGTLCITIAANIADTGILSFDACFPDSVVGFNCFENNVNITYFDYFIRTAKNHLEDYAPSTAQKNINLAILGNLLVPLPPLNELNRIASKVNQLLTLCDTLKANLNQAQTTQTQLADAIVKQAVN